MEGYYDCYKRVFSVYFLIHILLLSGTKLYGSHAQSADLTYKYLGGNQYELTLSFYRDCAGVGAPNSVSINISSASCGSNFSATLLPIVGTGNNVTPICAAVQTVCSGGKYPGVQEYVYKGTITLPLQCADWVFSFSLCCRNAAINTINNPGGQNIYVKASLDNLNFPCNNSPVFSNKPIPFVCAGDKYCFNHGATDADGDSLVYSLIAPATSASTSVTYINPYSATQPLLSNPAVSFNSTTGDICMTPIQLEVAVMAVKVEEYRKGKLIGSVVRDIQLRVIACNNNNPNVTGINGTTNFTLTACAGAPITFTVNSSDLDSAQTVTMTWNNGIPGASLTTSTGTRPTGTFSWTPTAADISANGHCFTITVKDDNCPYNGSQTFAFCITVVGVAATTTTTPANCNASNGSATIITIGGNAPFTYQWSSKGGNTPSANGLSAGTYTFSVTESNGCFFSDTVNVANGGSPGNVIAATNSISCFGGNDGIATINGSGGQKPYSYQWSNGTTSATATGLTQGVYQFSLTTNNGCVTTGSLSLTQPTAVVPAISSSKNVLCTGGNTGNANISASGGTSPYNFLWSGSNATTAAVSGLAAGTYNVIVADNNGCTANTSVTITQPLQLVVATSNSNNVTCNGGNNGSVNVNTSGGIPPYAFVWSTGAGTSASLNNLPAGSYSVMVTDMNGCTAVASASVFQPSVLFSNLLGIKNVNCNNGNDGNATITVNGGTAPYNYIWSTPTGNNNMASSLGAGNYSVTVNDNNGCSTNAVITITQPTLLNINPALNTNVSCFGGNNGIANVNTGGGIQPYTYQWQGSTSNAASANNLIAGIYSVTVTDANGCKSFTTTTITQPPILSLSIPSTTSVSCFGGNNGSLTVQAVGGISQYNFLWTTTGATTSSINNLNAGSYSVKVTDANGCSASANSGIIQPTQIAMSTMNTKNISCFNGGDGAASVIVSGGRSPYKYSWSGTGITGASINNRFAGSYQVVITDNNGCTYTNTVVLTQPAALTSSVFSLNNVACFGGNNGSATVTGNGGTAPYNYFWTHNGNSASAITGLSKGNYSVRITDANSCVNTTFINITQPTPVVSSLQAPATLCYGSMLSLSASANGGIAGYTYNWITLIGNNAIQYTSPTSTTTFSVAAIDSKGCIGDTTTATVVVYNLTAANLTVTPAHGICPGVSTIISATVTGSTGPVTYRWNNGLPNGNGPHIVTPNQTTQYIVKVNNICNMIVEDTVTITVYPLPVVKLYPQASSGCDNVLMTFSNNGAPYISGAGYSWNFGDGNTANTYNPAHNFTQTGIYTVSLVVTSPQGCENSASTKCIVGVNTSPDALFDVDRTTVSSIDPVIHFTNLSTNATAYLWDFGENNKIAANQNMYTAVDPVFQYSQKGSYPVMLIATNNSGCRDTAQTIIEVEPQFTFYFPNSFTPNEDGVNDNFTGKGEEITYFDMMIFDRWGGFIYQTKDMVKGWDGTVNAFEPEVPGLIVQDGIYIYKITVKGADNKMYRFVGGVTMLK